MDVMYFADGWTWFHTINSVLIVLLCYFAIQLISRLTIRIINWFLLRSFAVISREWCFVLPPQKKTKLERSQHHMKAIFYTLALLLRWPGWPGCGANLWQCFLRATICFIVAEFALVFSIVFTEAFIRTGHYLALNLGWTPEPIPWWDYGPANIGAFHMPETASLRSTSFNSGGQHDPQANTTTDSHHPVMILYAGYGNSFRRSHTGSVMADLLRSSHLTNTAFPMTPDTTGSASLLRSLNSDSQDYVPWSPNPRSSKKSLSTAGQLINYTQSETDGGLSAKDNGVSSGGVELSLLGISTQPRRRFT